MDLVTKAEYKAFKGIVSDGQDAIFDAIIPVVTAFIERYCERQFISGATSPGIIEYWDGDTTAVQLKQFPVITVDYVGVSDDGGMTYTALVQDDPDQEGFFYDDEDPENAWILTQVANTRFISDYATPYRSLKIAYTAGYPSTADVPDDLKLACYSLIEYYIDQQYTPAKALAGANLDNVINLTGPGLPPHIRRILDLYRVGA